MHLTRRDALFLAAGLPLAWLPTGASHATGAVVDEDWTDAARQRTVPVRVRWPSGASPRPASGWPLVLYSHGLGGSREGGATWGEAWAAAGFVVVHLQHPGSDTPALRASGLRSFADKDGLRQAASPQQLLARVQDARFALDEIARRRAAGDAHWQTVGSEAVGFAGHSFGAHTTMALAGQLYPRGLSVAEPRIAAFIAFSPSLPAAGDAQAALARITRPMLCLTGTRDEDVAGTRATPERRAAVFGALPAGNKAGLVLQEADHMTFGGDAGRRAGILPRADATRALQAQHHALLSALTTDWWRTHLLSDAGARQRLQQPRGLVAGDVWQLG